MIMGASRKACFPWLAKPAVKPRHLWRGEHRAPDAFMPGPSGSMLLCLMHNAQCIITGTVVHQGSGLREETSIDAGWVVRVGHVGSKLPLPYILPLRLGTGTFEPYSLGEFATFALILNPSAKIMGITAYFGRCIVK